MLHVLKPTGVFGFYAGLNLVALFLIFLFLPETKQKTLEELDYVFAVPNRKMADYHLNTVLPWAVRRYVFLKKGEEIEPLWKEAQVSRVPERQAGTVAEP